MSVLHKNKNNKNKFSNNEKCAKDLCLRWKALSADAVGFASIAKIV